MHEILDQDIEFLMSRVGRGIGPTRIRRAFNEHRIRKILDLVKRDREEVFSWKGFGSTSVGYVENALEKLGLRLGMTQKQISEYDGASPKNIRLRRLYEVVVHDAKEVNFGQFLGVAYSLEEACEASIARAERRNPTHEYAFHIRSAVEKGFIFFETPHDEESES